MRSWWWIAVAAFAVAGVLAAIPQRAFDRFADGSLPVLWHRPGRVDSLTAAVDRLDGLVLRGRLEKVDWSPGTVSVELAEPGGGGEGSAMQDVYALAYTFLVDAEGVDRARIHLIDASGRTVRTYTADRPALDHGPPPGTDAVPAFVQHRFHQQ
ncbi:hypothetical protein [Kyrpidia spormannii]|uniref:Uncharacterized protein n=1 Tax=Kyrpidia spormannii TaxID=2055160 RepID=A0ACA8Z9F3_9BACL|nr:hypothetical protein [Kyrpidia spormannii]CAB3392008.1 conserved protein of unknown function [Kyrpidia spormannii]